MRLLIIFVFAALTASCASTNSVSADFRLAPAGTQGLVVGSITYGGSIAIYGVEGTSRDGASFFRAQAGYPGWPPLGPEFDPALKKKGATFAIAVAPGRYTLQRWYITRGGGSISSSPNTLDLTFEVVAGQATYLGNLHFDPDWKVTLEDQSARDLPILRSRFAAMGEAAPAYALRAGARIERLGEEPASRSAESLYVADGVLPSAATTKPAAFDAATMASVQDGVQSDGSRANAVRFFVVAAINGKNTERSADKVSGQASRGLGMTMRVVDIERPVPAGKVRLRLRGLIDRAAPIQQIFAAVTSGGTREVEGEIEVELKPDVRYRVNGRIDEYRSQVWLEDEPGHEMPGSRIAGPFTAEGVKANAAEMLYTCCNFHPDADGWVSDANWIEQQPMLPAGTPIRIYELRKDRAKALAGDRAIWLGLDYGRAQETMQQFVARTALKEDPTARIEAYAAPMQAAIRAGKVVSGMTKEQAIVALGQPRADLTRSIDQARWSYRTQSDAEFVLVWGADDRLASVEGAPEVRALVELAR